MRIIDLHAHPIHQSRATSDRDIDRLVARCRALGIRHMNALGDVTRYGICPPADKLTVLNDESGRLRQRHPDFFSCFCYLNPTLGERAVMRETERCVRLYGCRGIKLEKANNAAAACMRHVAQAAREFGLVVLQHTWALDAGGVRRIPRRIQSDPADTAAFARKHPNVTVIMAHLTGFGVRGILEVKSLPNVLIDTSGGFPETGLIETAVKHLGAERVCYGSDYPIREHHTAIGRVLGAAISPTQRENILYRNAARLLGLE